MNTFLYLFCYSMIWYQQGRKQAFSNEAECFLDSSTCHYDHWVLLGGYWRFNWRGNRYSCMAQVISGYRFINVMYHAIMSLLLFRVTENCSITVRIYVLMMVGMFWDVTQCNLVGRYWYFTGAFALRVQKTGNDIDERWLWLALRLNQ
jgi:hypothetical protein